MSVRINRKNTLENWLIAQRLDGSNSRRFTGRSNPDNIRVDERTTLEAVKNLSYIKKQRKGTWESRGSTIGAVTAAGIYSFTYPVTLIDGPLPFVDIAWAYGLLRTARSGAAIGAEIGSWFD